MYERERESEKRHVLRTLPPSSLVNIDRQGYTDTSGLLKGVRARGDGHVYVRPPSDIDVHTLSRTYVSVQALKEPIYNTLSPFVLSHASWFPMHPYAIY